MATKVLKNSASLFYCKDNLLTVACPVNTFTSLHRRHQCYDLMSFIQPKWQMLSYHLCCPECENVLVFCLLKTLSLPKQLTLHTLLRLKKHPHHVIRFRMSDEWSSRSVASQHYTTTIQRVSEKTGSVTFLLKRLSPYKTCPSGRPWGWPRKPQRHRRKWSPGQRADLLLVNSELIWMWLKVWFWIRKFIWEQNVSL